MFQVFEPNESVVSEAAVNLLSAQIINDVKSWSLRVKDNQRLQMKNFLSRKKKQFYFIRYLTWF